MEINFETEGFKAFLKKPIEKFEIDLSNSSVLDVLNEFTLFKRKSNPHYDIGGVIFNIKKIQENFGLELNPKQITDDFYMHFFAYLIQEGLTPSTIQNYFDTIRSAFNWGIKHNLPVSSTYDQYKVPSYEKTKVALTPDEVSMIAHFDIDNSLGKSPTGKKTKSSHGDTLKRVRDQFVLQCSLGQRYSDMIRINPSCFSEDKRIFTIVQQKTGNKAVVDIPTYAFDKRVVYEILERYNYSAPYPHSIGNFNHYLHELLKKIGQNFNDIIKTENKIRGQIIVEERPKWKAVSSHTARRSFATYNIARGFSEAKIRRCTGHKDSRSFCQYIIWETNE